jgi:pyridoxamine 5'-phosphate oxidase
MAGLTDCIEFANDNPICFLATDDNGQPRVRALGSWFADETGFYFQTNSIKDLFKQISRNPNVEACYYKVGTPGGTMLRIAGGIEFIADRKYKEKVLIDKPFLKDMGLTPDSSGLILFKVSHGKAHFWTFENNLKPKEMIEF